MRTPETLTARKRAEKLNLTKPSEKNKEASGMTTSETIASTEKLTPQQARLAAVRDSLHRDYGSSSPNYDPMDEIDGSIITLDIDDIDEYSLNPRTKPNPNRADIKASMKADGITNIFSVTRRSPKEKYFPYGGGNTRVSLAKELVSEGVEKLRRIQVITRKWPGEAAVIAAHLSENDNRGDISFWERAQGVLNYKRELERETTKSYPASELNKALKEIGLSYGIKMIQNFLFAVENLALIGNWLQAKDVNEAIRPTVAALHDMASKFDKKDEVKNAIEEIFLMHATDLEAIEKSNLETDPEKRVEVKLDVLSLIAQIQSASSKHLGIAADHMDAVVQSYLQNPKLTADDIRAIESNLKQAQHQAKQAPLAGMLGNAMASPKTSKAKAEPKEQPGATNSSDKLALFSARLTQNLLELNGVIPLSDFVKPTQGLPYGFIADIPESMSHIAGQKLSHEQEILRVYLWPFLANQTGQCNANLLAKCDSSSQWVQAIQAGIEVFRKQCTDKDILCGKNGQIYVTSEHYGYLFGNAEVSKCLSALMQTFAEFNLALPEAANQSFRPLFAD